MYQNFTYLYHVKAVLLIFDVIHHNRILVITSNEHTLHACIVQFSTLKCVLCFVLISIILLQ